MPDAERGEPGRPGDVAAAAQDDVGAAARAAPARAAHGRAERLDERARRPAAGCGGRSRGP